MTLKNDMDSLASDVLATLNTLTDEVRITDNGSIQDIHYIDGNPNHKFVLATSRKGKTIFAVCPICGSGFIKAKGIEVIKDEVWCCSKVHSSEFETL